MFRPIRCTNCNERFYVSPDHEGTECQNCTGSHNATAQVKADAKAVKKANARPKGKPQSVDPRNPQSTPDPKGE